MLSSVDLPEPDGPVIDSHSPRRSVRSISINACTAGSVPKCLQILRSRKTSSAAALIASAVLLIDSPTGGRVASSCDIKSASGFHHLVAHDNELAGRQPPVVGGHLHVTAHGQARLNRDVFEIVAALDLHARGSVG